jgi:hypothetical protein
MSNYYGIGNEIIEGGIFERFPELIPKGGENYWRGKHSKLLLVGESNYFKNDMESKSDFKIVEKWYKGNSLLIPKEMEKNVNNWKGGGKFNNIFKSIKKVLVEQGVDDFENDLLHEFKYYNYFLRPATVKGGNKFFDKDCEEIDCKVSYAALCGIINKDKPDIVIFASKYSHDKFIESYKKEDIQYENIKIDFVYHFSSRYWNNTEGKYKFENLLREYWFWGNAKCQKLRTIHNELRQIFKIEKELECFFDENGSFLSRLLFKLKDVSFYCQTEIGIKIIDVVFWTYFYETDDCKKIPALEDKKYNFTLDISNVTIVDEINKLINQII